MTSITEEIYFHQTLKQIKETEDIVRTYGHLIENEALIAQKSEMEKLFDVVSKELAKFQEKYANNGESSLSYLKRQIEIINRHFGHFSNSSVFRRKKVNYYYLILKKISQIEKHITQYHPLKFNVFVIFRTGFFFSFKENKKNTP